MTVDHFSRAVIASSLDAAATEMFDLLRKTATSPIFYEVLDVGPGITDPNDGGVTHLNDVVVVEPVFWNGECVASVASIAHWGDVECAAGE